SRTYTIKNTAGVYSCTCPAWMHQSFAIERRSCKHLKAMRGEEAERLRVGGPVARAASTSTASTSASASTSTSPSTTPSGISRGEGVAPALLLAHSWESDVDLTGWWMSEKLDGVRAYW